MPAVRALCPLPDTAHEFRCVARSLAVLESQIYLGQRMTETALKKLPLERYRIIHLPTHGLLAHSDEVGRGFRSKPATC